MRAPPRERPAIVLCPHDRCIQCVEVFEQNPIIEPMVMDIVQMDNIRLDALQLSNELSRGHARCQTVIVEEEVFGIMLVHLCLVANAYRFRLAWIGVPSIGNVCVPTLCCRHLVDLFGYLARTAPVGA